jgi:hypothetical protein
VKEASVGGAWGHRRNDERPGGCGLADPDRGNEPAPELPQRGRDCQDAVFGVRPATAGKIEVGHLGRRAPSRGVVEQRIEVRQPEAPTDEREGEEKCGKPPGKPGHVPQSRERRSVCLLVPSSWDTAGTDAVHFRLTAQRPSAMNQPSPAPAAGSRAAGCPPIFCAWRAARAGHRRPPESALATGSGIPHRQPARW